MTAFKIIATNHTSFTVSNLDRTLAFFRDALGFEVTSKGPRSPSLIQAITGVDGAEVLIAYVRGPGHSIELIEYIEPETRGSVRPRPCDTGFSHIAYDVAIDQGPNRGSRVAYLRDPDGITIEFIEKA
jgi:catechol 2,3-dioxygenase-like lactoylglutathione lyase family enzyme